MKKKTLLICASLLFAYLCGEIFFRLFPPSQIQVNDPYGYVTLFPPPAKNEKGEVRWIRYNYPLAFDHRGYYKKSGGAIYYFKDQFGGRWISRHARPVGRKTAIMLGDSITYGFGVRYEDTFTHRLSENLRTDFINLAEMGADSGKSLRIYEKNANRIPHQAVVYGLHLNDLIDFSTNYLAENVLLGSLTEHSRFAEFLAEKWDATYGRWRKIRAITSPAVFDTHIFRGNFAAILALRAAAKKRNVPFYVAVLPVLVDLRAGTFNPIYAEILRRLREQGIEAIDLTGGLSTYRDEELWILPFDQHPNEIAHGIFAEKLQAYFTHRGSHERKNH